MAKSLETRFAEYIDTCQSNLINILNNKGITTNVNDTLDALVNRVSNIVAPPAPSAVPVGYVRDTNLPDFDAMFDADTNREVNGGSYIACTYLVCYLYPYSSTENQQNIALYGHTTYPAKMVFGKSDREMTSTNTSAFNFVVDSSELYTLTDGRQVFLLKCYSNYQQTSPTTNYSAVSNWGNLRILESIVDNSSNLNAYSGLITKYYRAIAPLHNTTNITGLLSGSDLERFPADATIRLDGNIATNTIYAGPYKLIINGVNVTVQTSNSSTLTVYIGGSISSGSSYIFNMRGIREFIAPSYSQAAITTVLPSLQFYQYNTSNQGVAAIPIFETGSTLYIPDNYKSISIGNGGSSFSVTGLKSLHIPNTISQMTNTDILGQKTYHPNLTDLSMSQNAYSLNTTALTLYLDYCPALTATSINNVITALADRTGKTANTVRFSKLQKTLMTSEQITALQNKNWTVTFV